MVRPCLLQRGTQGSQKSRLIAEEGSNRRRADMLRYRSLDSRFFCQMLAGGQESPPCIRLHTFAILQFLRGNEGA